MKRILVILAILTAAIVLPVPTQADPCTSGHVCVEVDAAATSGPAKLRAQGFINGLNMQTPLDLVRALKPQQWRSSDFDVAGPHGFNLRDGSITILGIASALGAKTTYTLQGDWAARTAQTAWNCGEPGNPLRPQQPWWSWNQYDNFIRELIAKKLREGRNYDYWEFENEPDITYGQCRSSTELRYEQFRHVIELVRNGTCVGCMNTDCLPGACKPIDPDARFVGPSIALFAASYPPVRCHNNVNWVDFTTMLDHAKRNKIQYSALAWHELAYRDECDGNPVVAYLNSPVDLIDHVQQVRALIAARQPEVGHPELHINEYAQATTYQLPGWEAGFVAALEKVDIDRANRSEWPDWEGGGLNANEAGTVDALLTADTLEPQAVYWVTARMPTCHARRRPAATA